MTDAFTKTVVGNPPPRKWQIFDAALLVFIVLSFLIAIVANFCAAYRVGRQPWAHDVVASWTLGVLWLWLLVAGLVRIVIHIVRKRARAASVITIICFGAYMFFMWIPFGIGRVIGQFLLARNGVNQRVGQECLLIARSELYMTNVCIRAQSGTWELNEETSHLSRVVHEMQAKCPAICSLKPRYICCSPQESVSIDLGSSFDAYGYGFAVEQTNWVLRWYETDLYQRTDSGRELARLPYEKPSLIATDFGPWQSKSSN